MDETLFGKLFEEATSELSAITKRASEARDAVGRMLVTYRATMREAAKAAAKRRPAPPVVSAPAASARHDKTPARQPSAIRKSESNLGKCELSILTALAQFGPMRLDQVAIATGYSPSASTVSVAASKLKQLGFVQNAAERGVWEITDEGRSEVHDVEPLPTGPALAEHWFGLLGKCEREILKIVIEAYPGTIRMLDAAEAGGYSTTASTVSVAVSTLRRLGLVTGSGAGLQASERLV